MPPDPNDPSHPWAPAGASGPPPPGPTRYDEPQPPPYDGPLPPSTGIPFGARADASFDDPLGGRAPTRPGPSPERRGPNRTPWFVALGAFLVAAVVAIVIVAVGGDDATDVSTGDPSGATAPTSSETTGIGVVRVEGNALPLLPDEGDDPAVGVMIPTIAGTDGTGRPVRIEPGSPQLVVVMAHWCPHCQAEIPRIVDWNNQGEIPKDLVVTGVSTAVNAPRGDFPPASWLEEEDWPFPVLEDDGGGTAMAALGTNAFPTIIAVGADGRVALRMAGEVDVDQFHDLVTAALSSGMTADGSSSSTAVPMTTTTTAPTSPAGVPCPTPETSAQRQRFSEPPPMCIDPAKSYTAEVTTSMGAFRIALDAARAPATVNNFVFLARSHFYDNVIFHRVIPGFVIQGGDPAGNGTGGPGYQFADELPAAGAYEKYSVAMANGGPNTNGSQFFVITGPDGLAIPPTYSLFGKVVAGTEVVDAIQSVPTDSSTDRPLTPVVITSVQIVEGS